MSDVSESDLLKVRKAETDTINKLRDLFRDQLSENKSAEMVAGQLAGLACVLVFMAVGAMGKEEGLAKMSDCVNRAIKALPPDNELEKLRKQ